MGAGPFGPCPGSWPDGPVEGVVLRVDDADGKWLKRRCKIVRPDFVAGCGDGHWATRAIERQRVDYELASQGRAPLPSILRTIGSTCPWTRSCDIRLVPGLRERREGASRY